MGLYWLIPSYVTAPEKTMNDNDILEMESLSDTEDFEGDTKLGIIDEEVGERDV